ncbi:hypothetical protein ACOBR2_09950 [Telmatobacter bradus]|uniref:hypothetical protein n=1 Tax=Telmatobacter bradus TaxID=474953 RepID=UPI003B42917E
MQKKILITYCIGFALSSIIPSTAQYVRVGDQEQITMGKLDEMENLLSGADVGQKVDLLTRLGIDPVIGKTVVEELLPGQKIALKLVRAQQETHYGVAFLPSFRGWFLYLLQGSDDEPQNHPWHVIDKQTLDCWHQFCVLELMALRRADADDLVVHNVNYNHGSNVVEDQTQVLSILNGKLVQTMVTQDFLSEGTLGSPTEIQTEHLSTFLRFPDRSLEETRTIAVNEKLEKVERRYWRWSNQKHRFIPSRFVSVVPNP